MKHIFFGFLTSGFLTSSLFAFTFGVVPQQSPLKLIEVWGPVAKYLEQATGEKVTLKVERSIPEFERILYNGGYDLAYMSPSAYTIANKKEGYTASARDAKNIVGILVVNKNSGIKNIQMADGKRFLFPAPYAFAATLLTKYELLQNYGIDIDKQNKFRYVNSHDSVYKGVARGVGDVGGGIERTFKNLDDIKTKDSLLILYKTKTYPSHPFAFKPTVSKDIKKKFTDAFLNMPQGLLKSLSMTKMIKTDDAEYNIVRDVAKKLKLENN
ncbi:phosphate/phosphite/phosphonate ABC transporter substrate-binding protein [bacterium]|nr:phosphate/phosphite/phosphonate ABC transporter substrate-binding protein [bacterium]MBU1883131.1 phosphate/phosphite/phosphonate ABC transporter substrate-binding protein [bacterium]